MLSGFDQDRFNREHGFEKFVSEFKAKFAMQELLDDFAKHALPCFISSKDAVSIGLHDENRDRLLIAAELAYCAAEAMLEARARRMK